MPKRADEAPPFRSYGHALMHLCRQLGNPRVGAQWRKGGFAVIRDRAATAPYFFAREPIDTIAAPTWKNRGWSRSAPLHHARDPSILVRLALRMTGTDGRKSMPTLAWRPTTNTAGLSLSKLLTSLVILSASFTSIEGSRTRSIIAGCDQQLALQKSPHNRLAGGIRITGAWQCGTAGREVYPWSSANPYLPPPLLPRMNSSPPANEDNASAATTDYVYEATDVTKSVRRWPGPGVARGHFSHRSGRVRRHHRAERLRQDHPAPDPRRARQAHLRHAPLPRQIAARPA